MKIPFGDFMSQGNPAIGIGIIVNKDHITLILLIVTVQIWWN